MDMQLLIAKKKFENQYDSLLEAKVNLQKKETNKNDNNNVTKTAMPSETE